MKQRLYNSLLIIALLNCIPVDTQAQFWKKIFGRKESKHNDRGERIYKSDKNNAKKNVPPPRKRVDPVYKQTVYKNRYRIDVFVALYLGELVKDDKPAFKNKIPDKAQPGFDFYNGVKLAIDTLNKQGYSIDVFVHDVTDPAEAPSDLIAARTIDSTDLIIGAVNTTAIPSLANYCRAHNINFVSALSPSDANVKDNPFFIMQHPSLSANCEWIRTAVAKKHPNAKPLVLYRKNVVVDSNALRYLNINNMPANMLACSSLPAKNVLQSFLDSTKPNVLIIPILDALYAESLLEKLNEYFPGYKFEVFGMPTWKNIAALKKADVFPNIAVSFTMPFYFDQTIPSIANVANYYKREVESNAPSEMMYRGYETLSWYAYLLNKYGTIFNTHLAENAIPFTRYDIQNRFDGNDNFMYKENKHVYLIRYQGGSYIIDTN